MADRLVLLVLSLLLAACARDGGETPVFPDTGENRVVFVNYWAEWCKPCRDEIPELNAFQREYRDEVVIYGVNFDGASGEALAAQEASLDIDFPTLATDPGPGLGWPRPEGLPYTMVTDGQGQGLIALAGVQTAESLRRALEQFRAAGEGSQ